MLTGRTITTSLVILAANVVAASLAQAHASCTPAHLVSAVRQVEAQCGAARIVSDHRPGATIRGTRRVSQHAACNGSNGAIDAVFANRACALSALRKTNYTILTYGRSAHIHIGTDGWGNGGTRVAQRQPARVRMASGERSGDRTAYRQTVSARADDGAWSGGGAANAEWSAARSSFEQGARADRAQRSGRRSARNAYARSAPRQRAGVRVAVGQQPHTSQQQFGDGERMW
jgi:hypothetical protein